MNPNTGLRKCLTALLLTAACRWACAFPCPVQEHYRWRKDDGPEAAASWVAPPDTPYWKMVAGERVRLRFVISNDPQQGQEDAHGYRLRLECTTANLTNAFQEVPVAVGSAPFVMSQSMHTSNGEPTTDLLPGSGQFLGGMCVAWPSNQTGSIDIDRNRYGNFEYCLTVTTNAVGGSAYLFRLTHNGTPFTSLDEGRYQQIAKAFVVGLPVVSNAGGARAITTRSARLEGSVVDAKGDDPRISIYWGNSDGGTEPARWSNVVEIGAQSRAFATVLNGLSGNETVYYRCAASNVAGVLWAETSASFTTLSPTVTFTNGPYIVTESATSVTVNCVLDAPSARDVFVPYTTVAGSATDNDYTSVSGVLHWATGETGLRNIQIPLTDDDLDEPGEFFYVRLLCGTNCTVSTEETTVVIDDDDGLPTLQFSTPASGGHESIATATIGLSLSPVSGTDVRVRYRVANGTATSGKDYVLTPGLATIRAGQTGTNINVAILEDLEYEGDETLVLTVLEPSKALLGITTSHVYTITDTDPRPPTMGNWKGAAGISSEGATLRGEVMDTGRDDPFVSVYWGATDGGTNVDAWNNVIHVGRIGQETFGRNVNVETTGTLYYYRCRGTNVAGAGWASASENFAAIDPPSFLLLDNESMETEDSTLTGARSWSQDGSNRDTQRVDEFPRTGSHSILLPSTEGIFIYGTARNSFLTSWNGRYWQGQAHPRGGVRPGFVVSGTAHVRAREIGMDPSMFSFAWRNVDESSNWMSNQVICTDVFYENISLVNTNAIPPALTGDHFVPALSRDSVGSSQSDYFHVDDVIVEVSLPRLNLQYDPSVPVRFPDAVVGTASELSLGVRNLGGCENTVLYGAYLVSADRLADPSWDCTAWHEVYDPSNCFNIVSGAALAATNNGGYQYAGLSFEPTSPGTFTGVVRVATTDPNDYYPGGGKLHDSLVYEQYILVGKAIAPPLLACTTVGVREGHGGRTRVVLTLALETQVVVNTSVDYATADGTATAGEDYIPVSGSAWIPAGETAFHVETEICGDLKRERDEVFYLMLSNPQNITLPDPPYGVCEIRDDESTLIIVR